MPNQKCQAKPRQVALLVSSMFSARQNRSGLGNAAPRCKLPLARQAMGFFQNCIANKAACTSFYVDALAFHCISVFLCKKLINKNVLIVTKLFQNVDLYLRSECENVLYKNKKSLYFSILLKKFSLSHPLAHNLLSGIS